MITSIYVMLYLSSLWISIKYYLYVYSEMLSLQQYNTTVTAHPMYLQTQVPPRNTKFLTVPVAHQSIVAVSDNESF